MITLVDGNLEQDANGDPVYGNPSFSFNGNSRFYYDSSRLAWALNLLPLEVISWREITDEIEPGS